jgi:hypothetical protein
MKPKSACPAIMLVAGSYFVVLLAEMHAASLVIVLILMLSAIIMNMCGFISIVRFLQAQPLPKLTRT